MSNQNTKYVISEYYSFTPDLDRSLIKESIDKGVPIILKGILQRANSKNRNGRVYPYKILKREVDKYQALVNEREAMGECVPADTKVFTTDGWKNIQDISIGETVFTLNIDENKLESQKVEHTIKKKYNDDLIHIYNSHLDMKITKKHKVILWDRYHNPYVLTGEELYNGLCNNDSKILHSYIKHSAEWVGENPKYFELPNTDIKIKTELWAAFLGIYISEGCSSGSKGCTKNKKNIIITQVKEESTKLIKELLDKLPFEYKYYNKQFIIRDENLFNHLKSLGNSSQKHIPDYAKNWSPSLLTILFDWLLIGDGKNRKNRKGNLMKEYFTISNKLQDDVSEIILKMGYGFGLHTRIQKDRFIEDNKTIEKEIENEYGDLCLIKENVKIKRLIKAKNSQPLHLIRQKTTKAVYLSRFTKCELIPFNDFVYCISVPNKTFLMLSDEKPCWTHNCDHPESAVVTLSKVSHIVTEMWWEDETLWGKVEIAETPSGDILKGLIKSGIKLGISSRGVGSVKSVGGNDVVQDDFELIAFDFVSSPSTPGAFMFKESKQWGIKPHNPDSEKNKEAIEKINLEKLVKISKNNFWSNI